jgi:aminopeptidase 2
MSDVDYRLPTNVRPIHYDLALKTDLSSSPPSFGGEALIDLEVTEDSTAITFNIHESLTVTHVAIAAAELKTTAAVQIPPSAITHDAKQERSVVDLAAMPGGKLLAGSKVKLFVRWESNLGDNMVGYYISKGDVDEATGKKPM